MTHRSSPLSERGLSLIQSKRDKDLRNVCFSRPYLEYFSILQNNKQIKCLAISVPDSHRSQTGPTLPWLVLESSQDYLETSARYWDIINNHNWTDTRGNGGITSHGQYQSLPSWSVMTRHIRYQCQDVSINPSLD